MSAKPDSLRVAAIGDLHVHQTSSESLQALFEKHHKEFAADKASAEKLISSGEAPIAKDLDPCDLAAWTSVSRALLNLQETITRN